MTFKTIIISALVVGSATLAEAQTATPKIDRRQENQERRIDKGVQSGALTPRETRRLDAREAKIEQEKTAAKSDGVVTGAERRKLKREENRASKAIHKQKHDAQHN